MRVGLCGAQRVGKTTLAREFEKQHGVPFVQTTTREVFDRLGLDAKAQYPFEQRFAVQEAILDTLAEQWQSYDNAIFDRTPLDVLAYTEADVLRDFPKDMEAAYFKYRAKCLELANMFHAIVLIQPGIPIVEEEGAAQGSLPYMTHFTMLCYSYLYKYLDENRYLLPSNILDLQDRVAYINSIYLLKQPAKGRFPKLIFPELNLS